MTLVASFVGVWIKISLESDKNKNHFVASLVGAWIKILILHRRIRQVFVASLADAWIKMEQQKVYLKWKNKNRRIPRGCVD